MKFNFRIRVNSNNFLISKSIIFDLPYRLFRTQNSQKKTLEKIILSHISNTASGPHTPPSQPYIPSSQTTSHTQIKNKMKTIHTKIVHDYISSTHNKILSKQPPPIHESETTPDHHSPNSDQTNHLSSSPTSTKSHLHLIPHLHAHSAKHTFTTPFTSSPAPK